MVKCLAYAHIGVVQLHIFAYQPNADGWLWPPDFSYHRFPITQIRLSRSEAHAFHDIFVDTGSPQFQGNGIQYVTGDGRDDCPRLHVTEQGDFLDMLFGNGIVGAGNDDVGLNTDPPQFADAMLGRFGFELIASFEVGQKGDMYVEAVLAADS